MIKDFEKFFIKRYLLYIYIYSTELSTHADVCCRSRLRSLRDGCLQAKYLETVCFILCLSFFFIFNFLIVEDLVSVMKKELEKEAMEQEIDE